MGDAKVVSLSVRPSQASQLCFEVGGILGESNAQLGAQAVAFDFAAFYAILGSIPTIPGHPARLLYDFLEIQAFVKPFTLVALRAETGKAALNKAINARANAYYAKYANAPAIISRMNDFYSPLITGSKPVRLEILGSLSQNQMEQLSEAYRSDSRVNVVKWTNSVLNSTLGSRGSSTTAGKSTGKSTGQSDQKSVDYLAHGVQFPPPPPGTAYTVGTTDNPVEENFQEGIQENSQEDSSSQTSTSEGSATEQQTIVNTDYGYRIPYLENFAQYQRAQISLIDEQFAQFMYGQNLPYLTAVFQNELNSIDGDVFRLQIAYLNTILMSPIAGTITGIYKSPGDVVRAGEPVIRVENNAVVLLVAILIYRGPISIGSTVIVKTALFDSSMPRTAVEGKVVAARGQDEDDRWEVIVQCDNLNTGGNPIFPFGYHFDYDDTTVSIT
jgi:hypothetical protein